MTESGLGRSVVFRGGSCSILLYFQSKDGQFKVSASKEEDGLAIASYVEKKMTIFYKK
jgi:hypothetical protein